MAAHARLKNEFTEDEEYHNLMRWLNLFQFQGGALLWLIMACFACFSVCLGQFYWFSRLAISMCVCGFYLVAFVCCFVLRPVKIILLILSRSNRKVGRKREILEKKKHDHPQAEIGLSHIWPELGLNPQRWDDERFKAQKISVLNHSATGA